jgi:hypothetical protein
MIDTTFNMYSDATGPDPDSSSPTLCRYHQLLWSKKLPNGAFFDLKIKYDKRYNLLYNSASGQLSLGSDSISHSYRNHGKKQDVLKLIPDEVDELFKQGSTIGGYIIFPNKKVNGKPSINQHRGINYKIGDRFDLTLECIKRFYANQQSPLYDTLNRYQSFFQLFVNFKGYVEFFLLQDLVDEKGGIKFYLPFDNFQTNPNFSDTREYILYKNNVMDFIQARNRRINEYIR